MLSHASKKYKNILFLIFAVMVIAAASFIASYVGKEQSSSGNNSAFSLSSVDLAVVSCSLDGQSGVSQGETLELTFNQPIPANASDIVTISPEAKGSWSVVDSRLRFTPDNRWAAGTLYTVTLEGNQTIRNLGRSLSQTAVFSFETQDSALRIPATATFRMDQRQYFFHPKEEISLAASYTDRNGGSDTPATVKVWRFNDDKSFIRRFSPLFSIPSWATITKNKTLADTGGLDYLGKTETTLAQGTIAYPSLSSGKYLFRIVVGGAAIDIAVTVDDMDIYHCFDGNALELWGNENQKSLSGAKIRLDTNVEYLDDSGCGRISYNYTAAELAENSALRVLEVVSEDATRVIFLDEAALGTTSYRGNLIVDKTVLTQEDTIVFSGNVLPAQTTAIWPRQAVVSLRGDSGKIYETTVDVEEDHSFSGSFKDLVLPRGNYSLCLTVNGRTVTETPLTSEPLGGDWGILIVSGEEAFVEEGATAAFHVQAVNKNAVPIKGLTITSSEGDSALTDGNGEAVFYVNGSKNGMMGNVTKTITFQCVLVGQGKLTAAVQYTVGAADAEATSASNAAEVEQKETAASSTETAQVRYFTSDGETFSISEEPSASAAFAVTYKNGAYTVGLVGSEPLSLTLPPSLTVSAGDSLTFSAAASGGEDVYYTAALYPGVVPNALQGVSVQNEAASSALWQKAVAADGSTKGSFAMNTDGLNGDYFLRVRAESADGRSVSGYLPVSVTNGGSILAISSKDYLANSTMALAFRTEGTDLNYQVSIDDRSVATGKATANNLVDIGNWPLGQHEGTVTLWNGGTMVDAAAFSFCVYGAEPDFMTVTQKKSTAPLLSYVVGEKNQAYAQKLFSLNLFPGDQVLQVLGRNGFYSALKDNSGFLASYVNEDFSRYQNSDGSFARVVGGSGDVLLSCFVAADENAVFNRDALQTFFRKKMANTEDTEVLALCYWGMSLLGEAPLEEMTYHITDRSFGENAKLYLAEAFYSNGDEATAERIFHNVVKALEKSGNAYAYRDPERNQSIFTALLTLDLSQKLEAPYTEGLLEYLMNAKLETQSNRYLMTLNLVNYMDIGDIVLTENPESATLYLAAKTPKTESRVNGVFRVNGTEVSAASVNDTIELALDWSDNAKKNILYMVYFTPKTALSFIEDSNTFLRHGHGMKLTMDIKTSLFFSAAAAGNDLIGDVYILNVTSGKVLAKVNLNDLVVAE